MRVTVLGSGSSAGTPSVANGWGQADPNEPKNRRTRPSIIVEEGETRILIDTSPDLRAQLLTRGINRLTAVLFTHAHADHCHGIDDLRPVNEAMNGVLPAYADATTWEAITQRFGYVLGPIRPDAKYFYKPCLIPETIAAGQTFEIGPLTIQAFDQDHGFMRTLGFRFGRFAYSTDVVEMPEASFDVLAGVETWFVGTLGPTPHPTHVHVAKALQWIGRVGPKRAFLTHMSNRLDYGTLCRDLPTHVRPAYDGMTIEID